MKVSPTVTFWISLITTIAQGIATGTIHLTGLVPEHSIPLVTGWLGLVVFVNMSFLTALTGVSSPQTGPLAPPPTPQEARDITKQAAEGLK
jgi:hypothetical protein